MNWEYKDRQGHRLGSVRRVDEHGGKRFIQYKADGNPGGFGHPLYGLERLSDPSRSVHVFEGEKCADAGYAAGLVAVSTCGGAAAAHLADVKPLDGFEIVVIHPDNDKPSKQRWVPALLKKLRELKKPPRVMVCELPGLAEKGDIVDWIQARLPDWNGFNLVNAPDELKRSLREAIKAHAIPDEKWGTKNPGLEVIEGGWEKPQELPDIVAPVPQFDPELLPAKLRDWAVHGASNLNAPIDYIAVAAMVEAGSVIGRKIAIRPKRFEDWSVIPNLWGAIIGPPSAKKSPSIKYAFRPIRQLQKSEQERFEEELQAYRRELTFIEAEIEQAKNELKAAMKKHDTEKGRQLADRIESLKEQMEQPRARQYYTSDSTIEKLAILLQENPNGLLQERDELMGWLQGMERQGREQDRPFYLETWDGNGTYTVNRVSRPAVYCDGMALSVFGGIQPGPTAQYVAKSLRGGANDDGMIQRFQLAVWPDPVEKYEYADAKLDSITYETAKSVFTRLDELTAEGVAAEVPDDGVPFLRFDDAAQDLFVEWITSLNNEKMRGDEHPAMVAHLAKYESLMPSLALILHLCDGCTGPVAVDAAAKAADWCEYLEGHARRLYGSQIREEAQLARLLADKIMAGKIEDGDPIWKIYKSGWSGLDKEASEQALQTLEQCGWLVIDRKPTKGKPKQQIRLNPHLEIPKND